MTVLGTFLVQWRERVRKNQIYTEANSYCSSFQVIFFKSTGRSIQLISSLAKFEQKVCCLAFNHEFWSFKSFSDAIFFQWWGTRHYKILKPFPDPHGCDKEGNNHLHISAQNKAVVSYAFALHRTWVSKGANYVIISSVKKRRFPKIIYVDQSNGIADELNRNKMQF